MECCCNLRLLTFPRSRHGALPFPKGGGPRIPPDVRQRLSASISTFGADYYRRYTGIFIQVHIGNKVTLWFTASYGVLVPRLCVKDTPVMRSKSASIPCLCVNSYPAYAWKSANFHKKIRKSWHVPICAGIGSTTTPAKLGYVVTSSIFSEAAALIPIVSPLPSQGFLARTGRSSSFCHHLSRGLRDTHYLS
jgi:hypothetical protein